MCWYSAAQQTNLGGYQLWTDFYEQYVESKGNTNSKGFVSCKCPFHSDRNASAGYNEVSGVFHCFACETKSWTPTAFLVELLGLSWPEASYRVDEYRREHGLIQRDEGKTSKVILAKPAWEQLVTKAQKAITPDNRLVVEYLKTRGISYKALIESGVGYLEAGKTAWGRECLVFPYTYNGRVCGIRLRDGIGNKLSMTGSHMTLWGIDSISDDTKTVIIVEGESDRLRVLSVIDDSRIAVVSTPGNQFQKEWVREFQGIEKVIVVPQADDASRNLVATTVSHLKSKAVVISLSWKRRQHGKDICDWLHYNDDEALSKLLNNAGGLFRSASMSGRELVEHVKGKVGTSALIQHLLKRQQLALVVGPEKSLKTFFVLNMARTVMNPDLPFLGIPSYHGVVPGNVLIIEEEGTDENLAERAEMVFHDVPDWHERTTFWHRRGVRLDEDSWLEEIEAECDRKNVSMLILDPMQDLHSSDDENSASAMAPFWNGIRRLMMRFPDMSIVLIHHFNKTGLIEAKWKAIRGSSRTGGIADVGFFIERKMVKDEPTKFVRFCIDGRELKENLSPDGKEVFECEFAMTGVFQYVTKATEIKIPKQDKQDVFFAEMRKRSRWSLIEIQAKLGVSIRTINTWVSNNEALSIDKMGMVIHDNKAG